MKLPKFVYEHSCGHLMTSEEFMFSFSCRGCNDKFPLIGGAKYHLMWFQNCPACGKHGLYAWDLIERIGRCVYCKEEIKLN